MKNNARKTSKIVLYDRLQTQLEEEYKDLQYRIDRTQRQILRADPMSTDVMEAVGSDQEALIERCCHFRQRLKMIVRCLQRIREGTFGLCELCEEPIGQKRLEALPTARFCIDCQQEQEQSEYEFQAGA